jgi:hypothetical protein
MGSHTTTKQTNRRQEEKFRMALKEYNLAGI